MKKEPTMHRFFFYAFPYHFIQNKGGKIVKSPPFTDKNTPISGFFYQKNEKFTHYYLQVIENFTYLCSVVKK